MTDAGFDEAASFGVVESATFGTGIALYHVMKEILAFHHGRCSEAFGEARALEPYLGPIMSLAVEATHRFYHALTSAALASAAAPADRASHVDVLDDAAKRFTQWAEHSVENFASRRSLLLAEKARLEGRERDAMRLYEEAIRSARKNSSVKDEALALELCAHFCEECGLETAARAVLHEAHRRYSLWGASAKVDQLARSYPHLAEEPALPSSTTARTPLEQLDLATVVRVLQALSGEIDLERWVHQLMKSALEDAGADHGLLFVAEGDRQRVLAEALVERDGIQVRLLSPAATPPPVPHSVLRYVARTREPVLADALVGGAFSKDPYFAGRRSCSVLCLPLVKQEQLAGTLYLENDLASNAFTPRRLALLRLLASQAAVSLENARLHTDLRREIDERRRAEQELRRANDFINEAQRLSGTGSFIANLRSDEHQWSSELYRIFELDPAKPIRPEVVRNLVHPEDAQLLDAAIARSMNGAEFDQVFRIRTASGLEKYVHAVARVAHPGAGSPVFMGAIQDVTASKIAEEGLNRARAELAHVSRIVTLGTLTASIAHEVNQPLSAMITNASTCVRMLGAEPPDIGAARDTAHRMVRDGRRAAEVVARLRALFTNKPTVREPVDLNEATSEVVALSRAELQKTRVSLRLELSPDIPQVSGDRVQLQQVVLNLLLNALEAVGDVEGRPREVWIKTELDEEDRVRLTVCDSGVGIGTEDAARLFEAFYTTKKGGMGIGLSVSRSIVESHDGRLWAVANDQGATFSFSLPRAPPS
jgi:signal transduction histidine kinase